MSPIVWQEDLLNLISNHSGHEEQIESYLEKAAAFFGFEHFLFAYRPSLPASKARLKWVHNFPIRLFGAYADQLYLSMEHWAGSSRPTNPVIWNEEFFKDPSPLWDDLKEHGIRHGVTFFVPGLLNDSSFLSFCRSADEIDAQELKEHAQSIMTLAQLCHRALAIIWRKEALADLPRLTHREVEVMKWMADGKTARDIAEILKVSKYTVDFHVKNSVHKLNAANKTSAVTQAALLGMLN